MTETVDADVVLLGLVLNSLNFLFTNLASDVVVVVVAEARVAGDTFLLTGSENFFCNFFVVVDGTVVVSSKFGYSSSWLLYSCEYILLAVVVEVR